ncbi:outer membrane protein [Aliarcobacter skirrowii]|uniref:outer membrane protein n=1 Tax=Aliarcobacter skirrowii TaxID=28200 RepID=UPI0021B22F10|nr:outer membrane beta-barrel protein [Aliarcobacter skirrowii]MCT7446597.1 outer membrane beta-barrel protein [Aliarcobacter skirrowii]
MKKSLAMASLLALGTSAMAVDVQPFAGLDIVHSKSDAKEGISGTYTSGGTTYSGSFSYSETLKDTTLGIKIGAILEKNHRVYFNYFKMEDKIEGEKYSYQLPAINYEYLIIDEKLNGFIPYVGAHIGYGKTTFSDVFEDKSSLDYGLNLGIIKDVAPNLSLELGYKLTIVDEKSSISGSGTFTDGTTYSGTIYQENKNVNTFAFGINYKF